LNGGDFHGNADVRKSAYSMPSSNPAYPPGPYRFYNRKSIHRVPDRRRRPHPGAAARVGKARFEEAGLTPWSWSLLHWRGCAGRESYEGEAKDDDFSGATVHEHWESGYEDTHRTLRQSEWLRHSSISADVSVHDLHREHPT
jgi:hypothetical protein